MQQRISIRLDIVLPYTLPAIYNYVNMNSWYSNRIWKCSLAISVGCAKSVCVENHSEIDRFTACRWWISRLIPNKNEKKKRESKTDYLSLKRSKRYTCIGHTSDLPIIPFWMVSEVCSSMTPRIMLYNSYIVARNMVNTIHEKFEIRRFNVDSKERKKEKKKQAPIHRLLRLFVYYDWAHENNNKSSSLR